MDISNVVKKLEKLATVKKISDNEYEIVTGAKADKLPIRFYLTQTAGMIKFCDKKQVLKFMNDMYDLKSLDVKTCIAAVVRIYGFTIVSGELCATVRSELSVVDAYYKYVMCIGQLVNMYAFFDSPQ